MEYLLQGKTCVMTGSQQYSTFNLFGNMISVKLQKSAKMPESFQTMLKNSVFKLVFCVFPNWQNSLAIASWQIIGHAL